MRNAKSDIESAPWSGKYSETERQVFEQTMGLFGIAHSDVLKWSNRTALCYVDERITLFGTLPNGGFIEMETYKKKPNRFYFVCWSPKKDCEIDMLWLYGTFTEENAVLQNGAALINHGYSHSKPIITFAQTKSKVKVKFERNEGTRLIKPDVFKGLDTENVMTRLVAIAGSITGNAPSILVSKR